jgi:hypothetical protein
MCVYLLPTYLCVVRLRFYAPPPRCGGSKQPVDSPVASGHHLDKRPVYWYRSTLQYSLLRTTLPTLFRSTSHWKNSKEIKAYEYSAVVLLPCRSTGTNVHWATLMTWFRFRDPAHVSPCPLQGILE